MGIYTTQYGHIYIYIYVVFVLFCFCCCCVCIVLLSLYYVNICCTPVRTHVFCFCLCCFCVCFGFCFCIFLWGLRFFEVVIGNGIEKKALTILKKRENLRIIDASKIQLNNSNNLIKSLMRQGKGPLSSSMRSLRIPGPLES